jgi:hypothetical protein
MGRKRMDMALAADRFMTKPPGRIFHHAKEKHPALELGQMLFATHVHDDAVHRIGSLAVWVMKTSSDRGKSAMLRLWAEHFFAIRKSARLIAPANSET